MTADACSTCKRERCNTATVGLLPVSQKPSLGNVEKLKAARAAEGTRSKPRIRRNGNVSGGCTFLNGALFAILGNRIYRDEIPHRGG